MRRSVIALVVGIILAGIAVYMAYGYMQSAQAPVVQAAPAPTIELTSVVVAKQDLPFGTTLRPDFLREAQWPRDAVPNGSFASIDELLEGEGERVVLRAMSRDEAVLDSKVSGHGEKPTLSRKIDPTKRAFSIRINDVSGVAGFLLPGDRVDVMLTRKLGNSGGKDNLVTDVILQSVVVLGIDQLTDEERENPVLARTATVEVTPKQAQKLALAQQVGTLSLALRNYGETNEVETSRVSTNSLTNEKPAAPSAPTVRVRRGSDDVTYKRVFWE